MQLRLLSWLFLAAIFSAFALRAQAPATAGYAPGTVIVAKVTGKVMMTAGAAAPAELRVDMAIPQNAKIVTPLDGSVVLVFSNGTTTQLGPDTEFVLEEFLQRPFPSTIKVSELVDEPSTSKTKLLLNKGEIVGNVKKLKHTQGSSFTVQTPVGAAGIRGTTFKIVFRPQTTGQAFGAQGTQNFRFELSTLEGDVGFQQAGGGGAAPGGGVQPQQGNVNVDGVSVPTGQEIVVTVTVTTTAQGQTVVSLPTVTSTVPINPTEAAAFAATAQKIVTDSANTTFTPPPAGGGGGATGNSGNPPSNNLVDPNAPKTSPLPTPPLPVITNP